MNTYPIVIEQIIASQVELINNFISAASKIAVFLLFPSGITKNM